MLRISDWRVQLSALRFLEDCERNNSIGGEECCDREAVWCDRGAVCSVLCVLEDCDKGGLSNNSLGGEECYDRGAVCSTLSVLEDCDRGQVVCETNESREKSRYLIRSKLKYKEAVV